MNLSQIKKEIEKMFRVPSTREILESEVRNFLENPENGVKAAQKVSAMKFLSGLFRKQERSIAASKKAQMKIEAGRKKEIQALKKLAEENPYFLNDDGFPRVVHLRVSSQNGSRRHGSFQGKAGVQLPAAEAWAAYVSRESYDPVSVVDFGGPEKPVLARFEKGVKI